MGGNKFFLSNLVSGGGHHFEKKFRAVRANIRVFFSYGKVPKTSRGGCSKNGGGGHPLSPKMVEDGGVVEGLQIRVFREDAKISRRGVLKF